MSKTSYLCVIMLHFECPVCQPNLYTVQPYFQPSFVVSAKIRLIRISAEKFVQPAEFKKNPAEGSVPYLDRFIRLCRLAVVAITRKDHATPSVAIGRV